MDTTHAADAIEAFLRALGQEPVGELTGTPARVASAWTDELLAGYRMNPAEVLAERCETGAQGIVVVRDIAATVICPHHLLPSHGVAHVAYEPGAQCVGLGALSRLVDCFGRRLALQEDVGAAIAGALIEHLGAKAAACTLDLVPTCMVIRGEREASARAVTTAEAGCVTDGFRMAFWAGGRR